ncbi:(Fe-S)-binding protein [bacterium]|nr:(Fe-S)-binding protein [bacterium]
MSYIDENQWKSCTLCGECLKKCPVLKMDEKEAQSEIEQLINGAKNLRIFKECTFCFNCNSYCTAEGLKPHEMILQRYMEHRSEVPAVLSYLINGMPLPTFFQDLYARLRVEEREILNKWSRIPTAAKEVLWIGCIGKISCYDIENSTVLRNLPKYGPADLCCGELAYRLGSWQAYEDTVERMLTRLRQLEVDRLVCYCGSCYNFLSNKLPTVYGERLPFKVVSMYQWLWENVEKGNLEVQNPVNCKAAIHESSYVSELEPEFADVLRKLYKTINMDTVELEHRGENAYTCGAVGLLLRTKNPFKIVKEHRRVYGEVKKAGVKSIALNCPGCYINLAASNRFFGLKLHYMPDELLRAFGDTISTPFAKRISLINKVLATRLPGLLFKRGKPVLERIERE